MPHRHSTRPFRLYGLALLTLLAVASSSRCKIVYVNKSVAGSTHNGSSWTTAYSTVMAATNIALQGDEIWVAEGRYAENVCIPAGVSLYGGFTGEEQDRHQRDWLVNPTVLGVTQNAYLIILLKGVVLDGVTVRSDGSSTGVLCAGTSAVANCTISGNSVCGVCVENGVTATIANCNITGNPSKGVSVEGTATIANCKISGSATGVEAAYNCTANVSNCTITGNGDGVYVSINGAATVTNCTVSGNTINGVNANYGSITIINCTMSGNSLCGVSSYYGAPPTVTNCIVAFNGTGIYRYDYPNVTATLSNNDVYGNSSDNYAGIPDSTGSNGNICQDPKLSNAYHDVHIQPGSPCIDAGDDSVLQAGWNDIDGRQRITGAHVDIGSNESDGVLWTVPSRTYYVTPAGNDASDGLSWGTAKKTVAGGVAAAQGMDEVWVAKGAYAENVTIMPGVALYGGFAGTEIDRSLRDTHDNPTVLSAQDRTAVVIANQGAALDGITVLGNGHSMGVSVSGGVTISDCRICENDLGVSSIHRGTVTVANCAIAGNARGVFVYSGSAIVTNCTISGNTYGFELNDGGFLTVENCSITGNSACGVTVLWGTARIANCAIRANGEGVEVRTDTTISCCDISANSSYGVYVTSGTVSVTSSSITANPFGIYAAYGGTARSSNCTISENTTGVYLDYSGAANVTNSLVAFNGTGISRYDMTPVVTLSHNDVFGNAIANYANTTDPTGISGNISADPLFVSLAGGDLHPRPDSLCVDAGIDAVVRLGDRDLNGKPRIIGAHVDIGAYELGVSFLTLADAAHALRIAAGIESAPADISRWKGTSSSSGVYLFDATRIARLAAGYNANP